ncbi:uncharacterized protein LOC104647144 [Solanum lycopersicum]|uniref:uncharacterized protein LOC104647144 n=1 Tax=Solanum lycopersicum TaxID=4081 RepID=UPI000532EA25|nr:uncharacterized protein LOC104647144 [Solanum lycopersicum]
MSIASGLVEAYVMKKLHEEKTKNFEKNEAITHENCNQSKKSSSSSSSSSGDWFTKMFKKVQPVTAPSSDSATKS